MRMRGECRPQNRQLRDNAQNRRNPENDLAGRLAHVFGPIEREAVLTIVNGIAAKATRAGRPFALPFAHVTARVPRSA